MEWVVTRHWDFRDCEEWPADFRVVYAINGHDLREYDAAVDLHAPHLAWGDVGASSRE